MPEQFLSFLEPQCTDLARDVVVYLAVSDHQIAIPIIGRIKRLLHQDLIFYFYYLYNYYTSFLALCQEKCSLIFKKFLSSPAPINWATNYLLLSHFAAVIAINYVYVCFRNISNEFIYRCFCFCHYRNFTFASFSNITFLN